MAGRFIVFEGIDTDVLTDQASRLATWLRSEGLPAVTTREPTDGPIGAQIRLVQNGRLNVDQLTLAALFLADRMDHLHRMGGGILNDLEKNNYVVCTRYLLSAYAYQSDVASFEWLRQINRLCPWPHLMIFIDTPVESVIRHSVEREGYKAEKLEQQLATLQEERESYLQVIERCRKEGDDVHSIDGNQPAATVHRQCRDLVERLGRSG